MKRIISICLLFVAIITCFSGCKNENGVRIKNIDLPMTEITIRHYNYVSSSDKYDRQKLIMCEFNPVEGVDGYELRYELTNGDKNSKILTLNDITYGGMRNYSTMRFLIENRSDLQSIDIRAFKMYKDTQQSGKWSNIYNKENKIDYVTTKARIGLDRISYIVDLYNDLPTYITNLKEKDYNVLKEKKSGNDFVIPYSLFTLNENSNATGYQIKYSYEKDGETVEVEPFELTSNAFYLDRTISDLDVKIRGFKKIDDKNTYYGRWTDVLNLQDENIESDDNQTIYSMEDWEKIIKNTPNLIK